MNGKLVGRFIYTNPADYEAFTSTEVAALIKKWLPRLDFVPDVICIEHTDRVRFIQLSDLSDPHPHAVKSMVLGEDGRTLKPGRCNGRIYHRLDLILDRRCEWYEFHKRVAAFEIDCTLLGSGAPKGIGSSRVWMNWIQERVGWDYWWENISNIRKQLNPAYELDCDFSVTEETEHPSSRYSTRSGGGGRLGTPSYEGNVGVRCADPPNSSRSTM